MDHWDSVIIMFLGLVAAISVEKVLNTPSLDLSSISTTGLPEDVQFIDVFNNLGIKTRFRLIDCSELTCRLIFENPSEQSKFAMDRWLWTCIAIIILGLVAAISCQKFLRSSDESNISPTLNPNVSLTQTSTGIPKDFWITIFSMAGMNARFRFAVCSTSTWGWMIENGFLPLEFMSGHREIKLKSSNNGWHMFYKEKEKKVNIYILQDGNLHRVFKQYEAIDLDPSWYVCWVDDGLSFDILIQVPDAVFGISIGTVAVIRSCGVEGLRVKIREVTQNDG